MTLLLTEIDFVGQGNQPDGVARSYEKHLATAVQEAVKTLSLRTIRGPQVVQVQIAEIKGLVSL
jgi:DNA primase